MARVGEAFRFLLARASSARRRSSSTLAEASSSALRASSSAFSAASLASCSAFSVASSSATSVWRSEGEKRRREGGKERSARELLLSSHHLVCPSLPPASRGYKTHSNLLWHCPFTLLSLLVHVKDVSLVGLYSNPRRPRDGSLVLWLLLLLLLRLSDRSSSGSGDGWRRLLHEVWWWEGREEAWRRDGEVGKRSNVRRRSG